MIIERVVVLPAPFGPTMPVNQPAAHLEVDGVDRDRVVESLGQALDREHELGPLAEAVS